MITKKTTMTTTTTSKNCSLRYEWLNWSEDKKSDRLFMLCPQCKSYGSHIGESKPKAPRARVGRHS